MKRDRIAEPAGGTSLAHRTREAILDLIVQRYFKVQGPPSEVDGR